MKLVDVDLLPSMKPLVTQGVGYIDHLTLFDDPRTFSMRLVVQREYHKVREQLDLANEAPWVRLRRALQGTE